jgi:hypothetical protein
MLWQEILQVTADPFALMGDGTRFWISKEISDKKEGYDVVGKMSTFKTYLTLSMSTQILLVLLK